MDRAQRMPDSRQSQFIWLDDSCPSCVDVPPEPFSQSDRIIWAAGEEDPKAIPLRPMSGPVKFARTELDVSPIRTGPSPAVGVGRFAFIRGKARGAKRTFFRVQHS